MTDNFKQYRNKETGKIIEGVFIRWFNKAYKFIPNVGVPMIFLSKRNFSKQYQLIENENDK